MKGRIRFHYDALNDIVVATPHWCIENAEDAREWYKQYKDYMSRFGRPMDFVVVLDHFEVKAAAGTVWGEYRAKVHQQFIRFSYRVHSTNRVKLFVNTSGVRYNVATQEAASIEDAVEGIKASRSGAEAS